MVDQGLVGGLAGLRPGDMVEVYAVFDSAQQRYRATRVESASLARGLRLRGPAHEVNTAAQTLRVGGVSYSYAGASGVPAALAVGQFVRLRLEADLLPTPRWVIRSFGTALRPLGEVGLIVFLRLTAFILLCVGVQIFWDGASELLRGLDMR